MNALSSAQSLRELKHNYRRLAKIHHPDKGGNLLGMQQINAEYERMQLRLKQAANTPIFHHEDFSDVYVGMELYVNGTPVEVLAVAENDSALSPRVAIVRRCLISIRALVCITRSFTPAGGRTTTRIIISACWLLY